VFFSGLNYFYSDAENKAKAIYDFGFYAFDLSGHLLYEQNGLKDLVKTQFYSDETSAFYYSSINNNQTLIFNTLRGKKDAFKSTSVPLICKLFNDEKKYFIISYFNEIRARLVD
jgi:hypothetical protein